MAIELKRKRVPGLGVLLATLGVHEVMLEDRLHEAEQRAERAERALRLHLFRLRLRTTRGVRRWERLASRQRIAQSLLVAGHNPGVVTRSSFWVPLGGPSEKWVAYLEAERAAGAAS